MTTLISLLGKGGNNKPDGYRTAKYRFDADHLGEAAFFGLALADYMKPQRLVLAGTAGSMWDVLLQHQDADDDIVLQLMDAVEQQSVTQALLTSCEPHLSRQLGLPVTCLLIPYAREESEQVAILQTLAETLKEREQVVIDVTHGFRHLPMLALVAARYLAHVRQVQVRELYYGALDMTVPGGETPVLRLGSLLRMLDWVESLATYEKDGDYGVFAALLEADGMSGKQASVLKQASFFERTGNPAQARAKLSSVIDSVTNHGGALGRLFRDTLAKRISWFRKSTRSEWERALGQAYLERGDYLRAATYLHESNVSRAVMLRGWDIHNFDDRKRAHEQERDKDDKNLEYLRNSMCHGVKPMGDSTAAYLQSEDRLKSFLEQLNQAGKNRYHGEK